MGGVIGQRNLVCKSGGIAKITRWLDSPRMCYGQHMHNLTFAKNDPKLNSYSKLFLK